MFRKINMPNESSTSAMVASVSIFVHVVDLRAERRSGADSLSQAEKEAEIEEEELIRNFEKEAKRAKTHEDDLNFI